MDRVTYSVRCCGSHSEYSGMAITRHDHKDRCTRQRRSLQLLYTLERCGSHLTPPKRSICMNTHDRSDLPDFRYPVKFDVMDRANVHARRRNGYQPKLQCLIYNDRSVWSVTHRKATRTKRRPATTLQPPRCESSTATRLVKGYIPSCKSTQSADPKAFGRATLYITLMILPQVHLRKPCYDFYFL